MTLPRFLRETRCRVVPVMCLAIPRRPWGALMTCIRYLLSTLCRFGRITQTSTMVTQGMGSPGNTQHRPKGSGIRATRRSPDLRSAGDPASEQKPQFTGFGIVGCCRLYIVDTQSLTQHVRGLRGRHFSTNPIVVTENHMQRGGTGGGQDSTAAASLRGHRFEQNKLVETLPRERVSGSGSLEP